MIKYSFELEDVSGSITQTEDGKYLLVAEQKDETGETIEKFEKVISGPEAAAVLFCSFDEFTNEDNELSEVFECAQKVLRDSSVELIP